MHDCDLFFVVISAEAVNVSDGEDGHVSDIIWPSPDVKKLTDLFNNTVPLASVMIPGDLIQRRGMTSGIKLMNTTCIHWNKFMGCSNFSANGVALIANTAYRNFGSILPRSVNM